MAQALGTSPTEETFEGAGGLRIFFRAWRPEGKARGVVVIVPGFNAHSGQYLWVAAQFVASGLAVYAIDLRGRGKSDGERFYVGKLADYVGDVAGLVALAKSREPGLPVFLLGHSAGGVVACIYTLEKPACRPRL
jgi:alpha-beta hydrolase superfamily lysophospholipase